MATFVYPSSGFDNSKLLLAMLGSHWASLYGGRDFVESYVFARGQIERQTFVNLIELLQSIDRETVPVFHTQNWYKHTILKSQVNSSATNLLKYGTGAVYGPQPGPGATYEYGVPVSSQLFAYPLPAKLHNVNAIFNALTKPTVSLFNTLDFIVDNTNNALVFRQDPFTLAGFTQEQVITNAGTDQQIDLWLYRGQFDWDHIYTHFGYVLGIKLQSSESYRQLVNAIFEGMVGGTAVEQIQLAISAMTGIPFALGNEAVQVVGQDATHKLVITDQNVYKFQPSATVLVSAGQKLLAGDALIDAVEIYELNRGQVPGDLTALSLGSGFLAAGYYGDLVFENKLVPLVVTTESGRTKVTFEIGGFPGDVYAFWESIHSKGIASGVTLANLLDQRPLAVRSGDPQAFNLPATINPLQFLIQNILRNNAYVVKIKASDTDPTATGLQYGHLLRQLIPPHTAMIVIVELAAATEAVIMQGAGSASAAGYAETPAVYLGMPASQEIMLPSTYIAEGDVKVVQLGAICQ